MKIRAETIVIGSGVLLIASLLSGVLLLSGSSGAVEPVSVSTVDTCVYPAHFVDEGEHEVEIPNFEALPSHIKSKLHGYLDALLGKEFAARLRFKEAGFMDPSDVPEVVQMSRELGREYEAYVVLFTLQLEEGREYCTGVNRSGFSGDCFT